MISLGKAWALATLLMATCVNGFLLGTSNKYILSLRSSEPAWQRQAPKKLQLESTSKEKEGLLSSFSPLYGGLWGAFFTYGLFLSPGSVGDPADISIIQAYIDNPAAPEGVNPVFLIIFNGLGVMPLVLSQVACPQGNREGPPAAPFLVAALGMGYGAAGLYLGLRSSPVDRKTLGETSWFTHYVLENKITSVAALGLLASGVLMSLGPLYDLGWTVAASDFVSLAKQSKLVSVSSLDLAVLTIAAASLIPRDLQLRSPGADTSTLGQQIAIGSIFFPILGAALYCLWRPSLPTE